MSASKRSNARGRNRKSGRPRPLPPEVNARNLAIEKQRREALNEKFLVLARLIPGLDTTQRPTKVLIVDESIRELEEQRNLYAAAMQHIQDLIAENERLSMEVDILRSQTSNYSAYLGNTGIPADITLQLMDFHTGIENNWLGETGSMYGSTQNANANLMGTSVQSDHYPNMADQSMQSSVQNCRLQGGFDLQNHQAPSTFDKSGFDSYLGM